MKKHFYLVLLFLAFAGFAKAQESTANWFGYILPPSSAENKYISFTMQDLSTVSVASDVLPAVNTATFANGYVWSVNNNGGYSICRSEYDAASNRIGEPEVMVANVPYINDMAYNPDDGLIYLITEEHLKCFDPANPGNIQDRGAIEHDGFNLAINREGNAYMISSWGEYGMLNLNNAQLSVISSIDLPIKMAFDMQTGELFGAHYGNLYQLDINTGAYSLLGALNDGNEGYDPTCLFMAYENPVTFTVDDLIYRVNSDNVSVTVTGHVDGYNAQGPLNIPASVNHEGRDYAVTTIEEGAFAYCSGFTGDLVIPNSVTYIGESAFCQCEGLNGKLVLGESVAYIGDWAFRRCSHITRAVSLATTPARLGNDLGGMVFGEFGTQTLTVPCGSSEAYMNSAWYDPIGLVGFYEFIEDCSAVAETEAVVTTVYPNPTQGKVTIEAEDILSVSIYNIQGQKVHEASVNGNAFVYDFGSQSAGVYFIKVETAKGTETTKVTVK